MIFGLIKHSQWNRFGVGVARIAFHLEDDDLLRHVHLRRRQTGAIVFEHRLDEIVDEPLNGRGTDAFRRYGLSDFPQDRIAEASNFENGHYPSSTSPKLTSSSARFSKRVYSDMNVSCTVPMGPLRCLAMMTSAARSSAFLS